MAGFEAGWPASKWAGRLRNQLEVANWALTYNIPSYPEVHSQHGRYPAEVGMKRIMTDLEHYARNKEASFVDKWEFGRSECLKGTELSCLGVLAWLYVACLLLN